MHLLSSIQEHWISIESKNDLPQRLHRVCVLLCFLPNDEVPFAGIEGQLSYLHYLAGASRCCNPECALCGGHTHLDSGSLVYWVSDTEVQSTDRRYLPSRNGFGRSSVAVTERKKFAISSGLSEILVRLGAKISSSKVDAGNDFYKCLDLYVDNEGSLAL